MEPDEAIDTSDLPQGDNEAVGSPQAAPQPQGDDNSITAPGPARQGQDMPQDQAPAQGEAPKRFGPLGRIVSYLMGEGAVPPQVLQQAGQQIDPHGQMSQSDRNLMVVEDANKRAGPEAAWKIVQANRVAYNAKQAFGYAALNGNQQKPPDINAAVDAANQAADHVLDGSNVRFAPGQGGVTATVKGPDGNTQQFNLTPDQFRKYLNVGGDGQYDKQMQQGGIARTLTNITQNQQRVSSVGALPPLAGAKPQSAQDQAQDDDQDNEAQAPDTQLGAKVNGFGPTIDPDSGYSAQLQRRANAMFPPGAASNHERQNWMATQQSAEDALKNKVDIADSNSEARVKAAEVRAKGGVDTQHVKNEGAVATKELQIKGWQYAADAKRAAAQITADQKAAAAGDKAALARTNMARQAIAVKHQTGKDLTPEETALQAQLTQQGQQAMQGQRAPTQAAPQRQAPQPAAPGAPPVPGARQYKGQWYTRGPNGEAVPVQQ